jgi:hypothetical protein
MYLKTDVVGMKNNDLSLKNNQAMAFTMFVKELRSVCF